MIINMLQKNTTTSISRQTESFSYDFQSKKVGCLHDSADQQEKIEPFGNEEDALEFANYYSQMVIDETR